MYNNIQDELLNKGSVFLSLYLLNQWNLPNTLCPNAQPPLCKRVIGDFQMFLF